MDKKTLHMVSFILVIIGGLNWGLFGLLNFDLIDYVFTDSLSVVGKIIYTLVGVSAVYLFSTHFSDCKVCEKKK